MKIRQCFCEL